MITGLLPADMLTVQLIPIFAVRTFPVWFFQVKTRYVDVDVMQMASSVLHGLVAWGVPLPVAKCSSCRYWGKLKKKIRSHLVVFSTAFFGVIYGFGTLLQSTPAVLWRFSGTFPYYQNNFNVLSGLEQRPLHFSTQPPTDWATTTHDQTSWYISFGPW